MPLTLTILVGLMQVGPNQCQFELLQPTGEIDTHTIECRHIYDERLLTVPTT